jgi:hypothetical protein
MLLFVQVFVAVFIASYLGKMDQPEPEGASSATAQSS